MGKSRWDTFMCRGKKFLGRLEKKRQRRLMQEYPTASEERKRAIIEKLVDIGMCLDKCRLGECSSKEDIRAIVIKKLNKPKLKF